MILEEARAARLLADRISSLLSIVAALGRARDREIAATERAERADDEVQRLEHVIHGEARRLSAFAERLARPVRRAVYSASARTALEAAERLGTQVPFVALVVPRGVDAVAWAALVHCSSPRREGPLVVVDLLSSSDDAAGLGDDENRSFLRFADGGTLVVLGLTAAPLEVHDKFAIALSRRAAHVPRSSILPPGVVIVSPLPLEEAVSRGLLSSNLARWFTDSELRLPSLAERSDDLRALALDQLARKSVELARPAAGIEPSALRLLLEHAWPENELELALVLGRALAVAEGPAVTAADLARSGFSPVEPQAQSVEPRPASRRRASFRPR